MQKDFFDLGYMELRERAWYGLWSPTLDCFVLVHHNLDFVQDLQFLASNKLLTVIVSIDQDLINRNVIDNSCCINWTVKDSEKINFTLIYQKPNAEYKVDLVASQVQDKQEAQAVASWFMFALGWVSWAKQHVRDNRSRYFISYVLDLPFRDVKKEIYRVIMLAETQQQAQHEISNLLETK